MERAIAAIGRIANSAQRAGEIVNSIRALIKKTPQQKEPFEINEAIHEILMLAQGEIRKNGISVVMELGEGLPRVRGDRIQLQQVMLNLINNAVQAMSATGVEPRELVIFTRKTDPDGIVVAVRDSGPGLDPASRERVFDARDPYQPPAQAVWFRVFLKCESESCTSYLEVESAMVSSATANEIRGFISDWFLDDAVKCCSGHRAKRPPEVVWAAILFPILRTIQP